MPATPNQKAFVAKRLGRQKMSTDDLSRDEKFVSLIENLTKGQASNIIIRLKHGAQVRYHRRLLKAEILI
jgi:ATP-dependent helicase IRC3